jgi:signal transduction histidine kinase
MTTVEDVTRVEAISHYDLIDSPPRSELEGLVRLAALLCGVPTAVINIIDDRFQHQIAAVGMEPAVCAREDSLCVAVLAQRTPVVVPDAREDPRFSANPFVTGDIARVRFYASSPLVTPDGVVIGTLCVFDENVRDLDSETQRALDILAGQVIDILELRRITRELLQTNEMLSQFAGQISHDLRNPLTALTGFLELASDSPDIDHAPQAARSLAHAESAADRMAAMIADLLEYARRGSAAPRPHTVRLDELVTEVVKDLRVAITAAGADVVVDADLEVWADRTLLGVVIQNLIANAVKFAAADGVEPRVEVRAEVRSPGWLITVDDNGPGVPVALRRRVFDFMDRGNAEGVDGLGIGLATCRRIIQAHGGRIGIDDSSLGGARVWITLPSRPGER